MDKIEKIRQEIERRKVQYYELEMKAWDDNGEYGDEDCYFYQGKRKACEGLLCFLDTLSEEPDKSLEEAARHSEILTYPMPYGADIKKVMKVQEARVFHEIGFKAGASWQKEQMLKDAVEGEVRRTDKHTHTSVRYKAFYGTDRYFYGIADKQFKPGDKVRIIIVKEDVK